VILYQSKNPAAFLEKKSQKKKKFSKKKNISVDLDISRSTEKNKKLKKKRKSEIYFLRMVLAFGRKWVWSNPGRLLKIVTV
jgi:hypothetical protein